MTVRESKSTAEVLKLDPSPTSYATSSSGNFTSPEAPPSLIASPEQDEKLWKSDEPRQAWS